VRNCFAIAIHQKSITSSDEQQSFLIKLMIKLVESHTKYTPVFQMNETEQQVDETASCSLSPLNDGN